MSSPWRTGPKIGGLDALAGIVELAKEMLTVKQLERVDEMAMTLLTRRRQRRQVQWELIMLGIIMYDPPSPTSHRASPKKLGHAFIIVNKCFSLEEKRDCAGDVANSN
jgi:hypothetical protein